MRDGRLRHRKVNNLVTPQPVGELGMGPRCFDYEARETCEVKVLLP